MTVPANTGVYTIKSTCSEGYPYTCQAEWNGNTWRDMNGKVIRVSEVKSFSKAKPLDFP